MRVRTTIASPGAVTRAAPAKINLYLHVTGRRGDGYHLLDSLVAFAELADTVTVRPADTLGMSLDGPFSGAVGAGDGNLAVRAARALAEAAETPAKVHINLTQRLPVAAGVGGGSADAAATLKALCALWSIPPGRVDLAALGQALGADVPVCLAGRGAFVGGVGERITPGPDLPAAGLLLVNPGVALGTREVFEARRGAFSRAARFSDVPGDAAALAALLGRRRNDLTAPATALCPAIGDALATLAATPGCRLARMSGSGATCFGLFDDAGAARRAAAFVGREGWWVAATRVDTGESPGR